MPPKDVPRVPWQGPVEPIVRLRPEFVVRQAPRAAGDAFESALRRAGIHVLSLPSETIADVREAIPAIGEALGIDARGYLERFDRDLALAKKKDESIRYSSPGPIAEGQVIEFELHPTSA